MVDRNKLLRFVYCAHIHPGTPFPAAAFRGVGLDVKYGNSWTQEVEQPVKNFGSVVLGELPEEHTQHRRIHLDPIDATTALGHGNVVGSTALAASPAQVVVRLRSNIELCGGVRVEHGRRMGIACLHLCSGDG